MSGTPLKADRGMASRGGAVHARLALLHRDGEDGAKGEDAADEHGEAARTEPRLCWHLCVCVCVDIQM